ncbi:AAA+ family ATPase [Pseudoroseicyclus tamaricis]|uniref:AAA+ family ATPase n=1 Tax=Pseudoroseicyclus tamaricis TaxID=2705421 RepID=A0A6B2JSJ8_9RHOB|nr:AAA+ family ATPase [Pseudoroseicyclus tamaricis]NDV00995.1 AAA+ family ATPase [Pseudoroseicyclus tamaricis]
MKQIALAPALALALLAQPAAAQEDGDGFNLMEEGARLFMQGLMDEMDPALDQLRDFAEDLEPAMREMTAEMAAGLADILETIDSVRYYEMPEITESGDIIIRRKPDAPPYVPEVDEGEEIEL